MRVISKILNALVNIEALLKDVILDRKNPELVFSNASVSGQVTWRAPTNGKIVFAGTYNSSSAWVSLAVAINGIQVHNTQYGNSGSGRVPICELSLNVKQGDDVVVTRGSSSGASAWSTPLSMNFYQYAPTVNIWQGGGLPYKATPLAPERGWAA